MKNNDFKPRKDKEEPAISLCLLIIKLRYFCQLSLEQIYEDTDQCKETTLRMEHTLNSTVSHYFKTVSYLLKEANYNFHLRQFLGAMLYCIYNQQRLDIMPVPVDSPIHSGETIFSPIDTNHLLKKQEANERVHQAQKNKKRGRKEKVKANQLKERKEKKVKEPKKEVSQDLNSNSNSKPNSNLNSKPKLKREQANEIKNQAKKEIKNQTRKEIKDQATDKTENQSTSRGVSKLESKPVNKPTNNSVSKSATESMGESTNKPPKRNASEQTQKRRIKWRQEKRRALNEELKTSQKEQRKIKQKSYSLKKRIALLTQQIDKTKKQIGLKRRRPVVVPAPCPQSPPGLIPSNELEPRDFKPKDFDPEDGASLSKRSIIEKPSLLKKASLLKKPSTSSFRQQESLSTDSKTDDNDPPICH